MFSPVLRHRQKKLAAIAAGSIGRNKPDTAPPMPETGEAASEYQQLLARLHDDLRTLHDIESLERKIEKKRSLIGPYLAWCEGALQVPEGTRAPQDEIVVQVMIWAVDIGEWDLALNLFDHVFAHRLDMPERYRRSAAAFVVEQVAEAAIANPGSVPHAVLERIRPGEGDAWDMPDQVTAKYHRALGESWAAQAAGFDPSSESAAAGGKPALVDAAIGELTRAIALDERVGSKTQLRELEREAKKLAEEAGANKPADGTITVPPAQT